VVPGPTAKITNTSKNHLEYCNQLKPAVSFGHRGILRRALYADAW
jgi:hypothetical protein